MRINQTRSRHRGRGVALLATSIALSISVGACAFVPAAASQPAPPRPTCGGLKILIEDALPCDQLVQIALGALAQRAPDQLARGVTGITVELASCPRDEVPPQIRCGTETFAQLVSVEFAPAQPGGPIEPSLTVAIAPGSGVVLGISNPLIR